MTEANWAVVDHWLDRLGWSGVPERKPRTTSSKRPTGHYTQREVAERLGISAGRVDQIEKEALGKCRAYCQRNGLRLEDLLR